MRQREGKSEKMHYEAMLLALSRRELSSAPRLSLYAPRALEPFVYKLAPRDTRGD